MKNLIWLAALLGFGCAHRIDPASLRLAGRQDIDITRDANLATPTMVRGSLADLSKIKKEKRAEPLLQFLKENPDLFKLQSPEMELRLIRSEDDDLGFTHYRYERLIKDIPVYNDELIMHVNNKAEIYQVNGHYHPTVVLKSDPAISEAKAGSLALEHGKTNKMQKVDKTELVFYPGKEGLSLAWHVTLSGGMNTWDYFIDAQSGSVLFDQDRRRF